MWAALLVLPWQPWRNREQLTADGPDDSPDDGSVPDADLSDVTVLIPARDEADVIGRNLTALKQQGRGLRVVLVDDKSEDNTADIASAVGLENLTIIQGEALPEGWTGKLWALEQARAQVDTPLVLLLDADILLKPGTIAALRSKLIDEERHLVSLMAWLRMRSFWEKLLMPAFIYFFRLLYPFSLSNQGSRWVAAAAGGCVLLDRSMLDRIGGFEPLRDALIDDCSLARRVRDFGGSTWVGVTRSAISLREYNGLDSVRAMVSRSAYTQLHYSILLLLLCTLLMGVSFVLPVLGLFQSGWAALLSALALFAMMASYLPTLRYYGLSPAWALCLPIIGALYLAMTWESAIGYWRGLRSQWRGRTYYSG